MNARLYVDEGLQPERTELAWQRTALSIGVGSLILVRLLPAVFGGVEWIAPGIAGLLLAGFFWVASGRRYREAPGRRSPRGSEAAVSPGGGLLLILTVAVVLFGVLGAGIIVLATLQN